MTVDTNRADESLVRFHPLQGAQSIALDYRETGGKHALRELVISRGRTGYLALYRVDEAKARVLVLAIRHQREAGFSVT